eukprot:scaffold443695_cov19-Prasinocladus_malaysianus.AAC.1
MRLSASNLQRFYGLHFYAAFSIDNDCAGKSDHAFLSAARHGSQLYSPAEALRIISSSCACIYT